ncbi:MAG: protein kinase domain-containing protein [Candidatus Sulfotelmatobacter sp.]
MNQPTKIGRYDVLRVIGRGGMGVVYEALDPKLERHVAIKMILGATPGLLARFDREARSMGSLQHPNIVTIHEFGDQDGSPYLVMEYLVGMSLETAISSGRPLSLVEKLSICINVCEGLNYAHDRGIIHRDIKPANVMLLDDGNVKIVDFGIARIGDTGISRTEIVGSLHYMSPEQFQSQPLDRRTDIFSTGVVLYQMLAGTLPFQATGGEAAVMYQIIHGDPAPLNTFLQDYPPELDAIIAKVLAKNRDLRYLSAHDLAFDLQAVVEKQKHEDVVQWMKRAEMAVQRTEWNKAEECLKQALKADKHYTLAHQMMGEVQARMRQQRNLEQLRQLRTQADEAYLERRYDDALRALDQALSIDQTNQDLSGFRKSIQEAKYRAARLKLALRRAEEAQQAGDLDGARLAVNEALEIDPGETAAKALHVVILKQLEEQERQQRLRKLFDSARDQIAARDLTSAFKSLKEAEIIDPASVELYSLLKVVSAAREEQFRKAEMEKLTRDIEQALGSENYAAAIAIADEGLQRYPREQALSKLKALAEAQQHRVQLKIYARDQFLVANGLLEAGKSAEALAALENALRTVPDDSQLQRLRDLIKERITAEEAEARKRQVVERARALAATERFDEAVRLLENAKRDFSGTEEIDGLLERTHAAQKQAEAVAQALSRAQQLLNQGSAEHAVQFLEDKTLELSDIRLFDQLEIARRRREQVQLEAQSAIAECNRILRQQGAAKAATYIDAQPAEYRGIPEYKVLIDVVAQRVAAEALEQELARRTEPDAQIRVAEAALARNPGNEEIRNSLTAARSRKQQIGAIAEKARALETSQKYVEAAEELQRMHQFYPQYPNLESEIRRLERLEEQRLLENARRQLDEFQSQVQRSIDEGQRILRERGAAETARYLGEQSTKYREIAEYKAFIQVVADRAASEALDQELARTAELEAQVRVAEAALVRNPANEEIRKKLADRRGRKQQITAIAEKARALETTQRYGDAVQELQRLRQIYPEYPNLESEIRRLDRLEEQRRLETARRQMEQFRSELQNSIEGGKRILRESGAAAAAKYLDTLSPKLRVEPEYKAFAEVVARRAAADALERELSRKKDLDAQIRLAEEAFRENPGNEEIGEKLAALRDRKQQIAAIADRVQLLESSRRYAEAALELQRLRELHPQYPKLESEIRRLERLEEQSQERQRKEIEQKTKAKTDASPVERRDEGLGATVIMGRKPLAEAQPAIDSPAASVALAEIRSASVRREVPAEVLVVRAHARSFSKILIAAAVAVVLVVGLVVAWMLHRPTDASIKNTPAQVATTGGVSPVQSKGGDAQDNLSAKGTPEIVSTKTKEPENRAKPPIQPQVVEKQKPPLTPAAEKNPITEVTKVIPPSVPAANASSAAAQPAKAPPPPPTGSFDINPKIIEKGKTATLTWNIQNADTVEVNGQQVKAAGSMTVTPTEATTTYRLTAKGPGGEYDFGAMVMVTAPAPAPAPKTETSSISQDDKDLIVGVLQKYSQGFANKDAKSIQAVWPGLPKETLNAIKNSFRQDTRLNFSNFRFDRLDDSTVRVSCTQSVKEQREGKPLTSDRQLTVIVKKNGSIWQINYIPLNN